MFTKTWPNITAAQNESSIIADVLASSWRSRRFTVMHVRFSLPAFVVVVGLSCVSRSCLIFSKSRLPVCLLWSPSLSVSLSLCLSLSVSVSVSMPIYAYDLSICVCPNEHLRGLREERDHLWLFRWMNITNYNMTSHEHFRSPQEDGDLSTRWAERGESVA